MAAQKQTITCKEVYAEVYKRVKDEGGSDSKAKIYAGIAQANCVSAGKDVKGKPDN
jgi:hypothetical protein